MEREQYEVMFRCEDRHWWYAGMRHAALPLLRQALRDVPSPRILDAGCGTGGTTLHVARLGRVTGVDLMPAALELAASRGLAGRLAGGSVDRLPFRDEMFDAAVSFEVLYHLGVASDIAALRELRRVLRPGGRLLLRLPAHDWLRGAHDRLVHTRHRYTLAEVRAKLARAGFAIDYTTWANSLLFAPAAAKRLAERALPRGASADEPDLWQPPEALNRLLRTCVSLEAVAFARRLPLPFGLSVIALAHRG